MEAPRLADEVEEKDRIDRGKGEELKAKTAEGWLEGIGQSLLSLCPLTPGSPGGFRAVSVRP